MDMCVRGISSTGVNCCSITSRHPSGVRPKLAKRPSIRSRGTLGLSAKVFRGQVSPRGISRGTSKRSLIVKAEDGDSSETSKDFVQNTQFGYSRKDVIFIGTAVLAAGCGLYYGLQEFAGYDMVVAGDVVLVVITLGMTIAWTGTYVFRVANKDMTYVKQLKDYEEAVMQKRLDELPEAELAKLLEDVEKENAEKTK
ncbi:hypothetical protein CYMTET_8858 [Cymbomonas tetramitiformis]|uniref:Uncharacterized protein n=1 Tax=Cymbomonas tetramitiformis TaxID=36881 RepID=A0AAE0GSN0_9CHLO|nr:hypothetical protein CYMTET_8858 [Cymbomonas tetramitiformis]